MIAAAYLEPLTPSHRPLMAMWRKPAVVRSSHGQEAASSAAPTTVVSRPARALRGRANTAPEGRELHQVTRPSNGSRCSEGACRASPPLFDWFGSCIGFSHERGHQFSFFIFYFPSRFSVLLIEGTAR